MGTVVQTNQFRKRLKLLLDGEPWQIVETDFVKPGKGQGFSRIKLKNLLNGRVVERTFKSGETAETADVTTVTMEYLYNDGDNYTFMDNKTYEQVEVPKDNVGDAASWLLENTECEISFWNSRVMDVTPPVFMDLAVTYTEPAVKGDTANNVTKKATLETGAEIDVPLFVEQGAKLRIDTRTGAYVQRVTD